MSSFVAVFSFPIAELAARFLDSQKPVWQKCVGRTVTFTSGDNVRLDQRFSEFAVTADNIFTIGYQTTNLPFDCGRALTVRNNISIDIAVCDTPKPADSAVTLAQQIAEKVPH